ncbi:MAG TPA: cupredoxin domain-containing protein [Tepidisphaeraceae bacterium]|nr:cupredoxin domain-containing protein [Tepidisphaeraceae bacterium]
MQTRLLILTIATCAALLPHPGARAADKPRQTTVVTLRGGAFTPQRVTVRAGDTVVWANADDRDHTVTAASGAFDSGNIRPGGSFAWRATKPGDYAYGCSLHPRMRGVVSVQ